MGKRGRVLKPGDAAARQVVAGYEKDAKRRRDGIEFSLSTEQMLGIMEQDCHYCGAEPSNVRKSKYGNFIYNGVDRVDNSEGYVTGNVVPCCRRCNVAKADMTVKEFLTWIGRVHTHTGGS